MASLPDDDDCGMDLFEVPVTLGGGDDGPNPKRLKFSSDSSDDKTFGLCQECLVQHPCAFLGL